MSNKVSLDPEVIDRALNEVRLAVATRAYTMVEMAITLKDAQQKLLHLKKELERELHDD